MNAALIVLLLGIAGLLASALLLRREPERRVRWATGVGALVGFALAFLMAQVSGKETTVAVAVATLSAAVLALALAAQWRLIRALTRR